MIQPLQLSSNVSFKSQMLQDMIKAQAASTPNVAAKVEPEAKDEVAITAQEEKKPTTLKEKYAKVKKAVTNVAKVFNNVTGVGAGAARGVVDGAITVGAVGLVVKACKEAEHFNVFQIVGNIGKDLGKAAKGVVGFIPSIVTKSPLENVKTVAKLPKKFYGEYLKDNKAIAAAATAVGVAVLAARTIQGKVNANKTNANIEHATNQGHV